MNENYNNEQQQDLEIIGGILMSPFCFDDEEEEDEDY